MTTVQDTIPEALRPEVQAALDWFNARQDVAFEVTGILDPEEALAQSGAHALRLVLCGGGRCEQRSFRVTARGEGFDVSCIDAATAGVADAVPQAELDPPPGARRGWLDRMLAHHAFAVLVFYRGYW